MVTDVNIVKKGNYRIFNRIKKAYYNDKLKYMTSSHMFGDWGYVFLIGNDYEYVLFDEGKYSNDLCSMFLNCDFKIKPIIIKTNKLAVGWGDELKECNRDTVTYITIFGLYVGYMVVDVNGTFFIINDGTKEYAIILKEYLSLVIEL